MMTVEERFLKYVSFDTQSDEESQSTPSTEKQKRLGAFLADEMQQIGLENSHMDESGYVYAWLPANDEGHSPIGFISHMDTAPAAPGDHIQPRKVRYDGTDIALNEHVYLRNSDFPCLHHYLGQDLIVTDGTTLLGADDKAGIAEIVTAMEYLLTHPEKKHGRIAVAFTPDEEIGRGADHFDIPGFGAEYAYTVDGGALGELEYECFNAASVKLKVTGLSTHTGSAKGKMKNAVRIAAEFISRLPQKEIPEETEQYEGFFHLDSLQGDVTSAKASLLIRDHDWQLFQKRKERIGSLEEEFNRKYGEGTVTATVTDSYYNMKEKILPVMYVVDNARKAMEDVGVTPRTMAIRGGTDGARLSFEGLPCPNLSTGGENFHGIHEFVSVQSMEKMTEVLVRIAELA